MKRQSILVLAAIFASGIFGVVPEKAVALVSLDDGQIYNINYQINDDVRVDYQSPGMQTTVNWLDGGILYGKLDAYKNSVINVSGGFFAQYPGLGSHDNSQVNVSGGNVHYLYAYDNSQVAISGGSVGGELKAGDNSQVYISGGSVAHHLLAYDNSRVTVSGGFTGRRIIAGGNFFSNSVITIIGSEFAVNGMSVGYGEIDIGGWNSVSGTLTGTLANGDYFNSEIYIRGDSKIVLAPIPAPGALILGSISVGFVTWLRRRKTL